MLTRPIFLIGMPGSGKSSLGKRSANEMGLRYVDTDAMLCETLGGTVPEIFAKYGEEAFRTAEHNLLCWLVRQEPCLISTGGGMVMREENRRIMKNHGFIVLVDRPLEQILSDIKLDRRPLLAERGLEGVEQVYSSRIDYYRASADVIVHNDGDYYPGLEAMMKAILRLCPNAVERTRA